MEPVKGRSPKFEARKIRRPSIWSTIWKKMKAAVVSPNFLKGAIIAAAVYCGYLFGKQHYQRLSEFLKLLTQDKVADVVIHGSFLSFRCNNSPGLKVTNRSIMSDTLLLEELRNHQVPFTCSLVDDRALTALLSIVVPLIGFMFVMKSQSPQTKTKKSSRKRPPLVGFDNVGGNVKAKKELKEVLSCLRNPDEYREQGVRIPKGVLLFGPPGTGKTMLAKAVARECDLPFLYASGSQFAELYVGMGPKRVRELFEQARKEAPCIIFIDELDALGMQRGDRLVSCREHDLTLNQLLNELDGFNQDEGVVVIAATNREKMLDKALVRAGRFDKRIRVGLPDFEERKAILDIHLRMKQHEVSEEEKSMVARSTKGLSGAELENIVNDAMISAIERGDLLSGGLLVEITKEKVRQLQNFQSQEPVMNNNGVPREFAAI